jgi:CheY-like chemotaxis protein
MPSDLLGGIDVLVVDDEEDARELMRMTLESYGARVRTAASAAEAMRAFDQQMPDVLISDIGMAGEDGYALIQRIRSRPAHKGRDVPAVALTAYASEADRQRTAAAGYHAHVSKPFEPSELAALVRQLAVSIVCRES